MITIFPHRAIQCALYLLLLIAISSGALRLFHIGRADLTRDEAFSWRLIQYGTPELIRRTAADVHPPLYYLVLKAWKCGAGDSIVALRALSVLLGMASVVLVYFTVLEAMSLSDRCKRRAPACKYASALLAAALLAVHSLQIEASRTARMYSLGVFLAVASSWGLLRARRAESKYSHACWWGFYGLTIGLFCLTHNFALFTLAAHILFLATEWLHTWGRGAKQECTRLVHGALLSAAVMILLFAPWVPVLLRQVGEVRAGYWIASPTWESTQKALVEWTVGIRDAADVERWSILLALGASVAAAAPWKDRAGRFFVFQATIPWLLCLVIGALADRPIFQIRYLVFCQVGLFGLLSVAVLRGGSVLAGYVLAVIITCATWGGVEYVAHLPAQPPPIVRAIELVRRHHQVEDVILANSQRTVNRLRYYCSRAGLSAARVRCVISLGGEGHIVHLASLTDDEIIWTNEWAGYTTPRLWRVYYPSEGVPPLPAKMKPVLKKEYSEDRHTRCIAELYVAE